MIKGVFDKKILGVLFWPWVLFWVSLIGASGTFALQLVNNRALANNNEDKITITSRVIFFINKI